MGHLLQHIEIDRRYMEGKKQELRKYTGLTLNQLTTKYPIRYFNLSHFNMAQILPGITTELSWQSWTALS